MNGLNFKLYEAPSFDANTSYVQFQVGKGKKSDPSVYVERLAFDCIRGVIWNKHREFADQKKINQINNADWERCLDGLQTASQNLATCKDSRQLMHLLSVPSHLFSDIEAVFDDKESLQQFIEALILWVRTHLKKAKYILIIRHD